MKTKWIAIALCIVAITTVSFGFHQPVQADATPPLDQTGPYRIGFVMNIYYDSTRSAYGGGPRPIVTFIWYPAAPNNNGRPMPPAIYTMDPLGLVDPAVNPNPLITSAEWESYGIQPTYQEVAVAPNHPFPLLVFSPGLGPDSLFYIHIATRLASHGFVVAIPTNYGDGWMGEPAGEIYPTYELYDIGTYVERTRDIQYLMTRLVADSKEASNLLYGAIRQDQIAVGGHSWGGLATLALAGGDDVACDLYGLDPNLFPPETCIPILPDPRIKAIVPLDGSGWALHYNEMARIRIPNMGIGEEWNYVQDWLARQHSAIQGQPNYRVDIAFANHMSLTSVCPYLHIWYTHGVVDEDYLNFYLNELCPQEPITPDEIGNLVTKYMIAFLKTELVGDTTYKEMLTPGYALVNEPFIEFFVTEKRNSNAIDDEWPGYFTYFMHQPGTEQAKALKDPIQMQRRQDTPFSR